MHGGQGRGGAGSWAVSAPHPRAGGSVAVAKRQPDSHVARAALAQAVLGLFKQ